jgi:putative spermidine/putrescine transport system substrate-binding protein/spermidine/putrescine transport system substrate-binding protein
MTKPVKIKSSWGPLSRRNLLLSAGAAIGAAACPPLLRRAVADVPKASGAIDFMSWEGYDFPDVMKAWEKENGVEVHATYMGSHDDIQAKILGGGGGGLDMITYGSSYKKLYSKLKILTPIDESKIPNLKNLLPFFASNFENVWVDADGTRTGVPCDWGASSLSYDSSVIKDPPTSYDILFDPQYKGKVGIPDDPLGAYGLAARVLDLNSSKLTEADFKTVTDWLKNLVKQTKGVSPSYGDVSSRFIAGDIVLAFLGWPAYKAFGAQAGKKTIETNWPKKGGGLAFSDAWAIPPGCDNKDTVYAWINETCRPEISAGMADSLNGGAVVSGAQKLMDPLVAGLYPYESLDEFFKICPLQEDPPLESPEFVTRQRVLAAWQEVKAG